MEFMAPSCGNLDTEVFFVMGKGTVSSLFDREKLSLSFQGVVGVRTGWNDRGSVAQTFRTSTDRQRVRAQKKPRTKSGLELITARLADGISDEFVRQ
jgi:hypothetical protein